MRQRRWLELIKDYDLEVHYHPRKANVVADALSRKNHCNCMTVKPMDYSLCYNLEKLNIRIVQQGQLTNVTIESTIKDQIISAQRKNFGIAHIKEKVRIGQHTDFSIDDTDVLWFKNRLVVPKVLELRQLILDEAHNTRFSIHPGSNKMYQDLKQRFWWTKMKIEIAKYVARCDTCR
jgi:hypothetical protein